MNKNDEFNSIVSDIITNELFIKLNGELHHGISRADHSKRVAKWTYFFAKRIKSFDTNEVTRAALLHDFYINKNLNDYTSTQKLSAHPMAALKNSKKYFNISEVQADIISKHMFPCTLELPKYKETWFVSMIDKIVGLYEILRWKVSLYLGIYIIFIFEIIHNS